MLIYTSNTDNEGNAVIIVRGTLTPLSRRFFSLYYVRLQRYAEGLQWQNNEALAVESHIENLSKRYSANSSLAARYSSHFKYLAFAIDLINYKLMIVESGRVRHRY